MYERIYKWTKTVTPRAPVSVYNNDNDDNIFFVVVVVIITPHMDLLLLFHIFVVRYQKMILYIHNTLWGEVVVPTYSQIRKTTKF